jgi:hypothetical protein
MIRLAQTAALLATLLASGVAFADAGAAGSCAVGLPTESKAIYDAAAPGFAASADPRALVKAKTVDLVKAGAVQRASARSCATAAGNCLKKLR